MDYVGNDQEVTGEPHLVYYPEFIVEPLGVLLWHRQAFESGLQPFVRPYAEFLFQAGPLADLDPGQPVGSKGEFHVAALRDGQRILKRLGNFVPEEGPHFLGGAEVKIIGPETVTIGCIHRGVRLDAEQDVVPGSVLRLQVMGVIGGHQGDAGQGGHFDQSLVRYGLLGYPVVQYLEKEIALAENIAVEHGSL